jgi:integrase
MLTDHRQNDLFASFPLPARQPAPAGPAPAYPDVEMVDAASAVPKKRKRRSTAAIELATTPSKALSAPAPAEPPATMRDVLARLQTLPSLTDRQRSQFSCGVRRLGHIANRPLEAIPATPTELRAIFNASSPAAVGVTKVRWTNLRSHAIAALDHTGVQVLRKQARQSLSLGWLALRDHLPTTKFRAGLSRFMGFCSNSGIEPEQVDQRIFDDFGAALLAETLAGDPKQVFRIACQLWNQACRDVSLWPQVAIREPSYSRNYSLPWSAFPASFTADTEAFLTRSGNQNPFAADYVRSVKPATVAMRRKQIIQMASLLVASGVEIAEVTALKVLALPDHASRLLEYHYEDRAGSSCYVQQQANLLKTIARHWVKAPEEQIATLGVLAGNLAVKRIGMTVKNQNRLRQFDNVANVRLLLNLPAKVLAEARRSGLLTPTVAKRVMYATAVELLIVAPMRIKNLTHLKPDKHLIRTRRGRTSLTHIVVPLEDTKTDKPFEMEMPEDTERLVRAYQEEFLPALTTTASDYLLPNEAGGLRNENTFAQTLGDFIKRETGLVMNPHLFRHLMAKLYLAEFPEDIETARRILQHSSSNTTARAYVEFKNVAAVKRYDAVIAGLRAGPDRRLQKAPRSARRGGR